MITRILNRLGLFTRWQVNNLVSASVKTLMKHTEVNEKFNNEFQKILERDRTAILTFIERAEYYAYSTNNTELQKLIQEWTEEFMEFNKFK